MERSGQITDPDLNPEDPKTCESYESYESGTMNKKLKGTCKYARLENRVHPLGFRHTARSKIVILNNGEKPHWQI
jgi:hypothetical protein